MIEPVNSYFTPKRGYFTQTVSGRKFWPLSPDPADVSPRDIAHSLAHLCRFNGHVSEFYSVAQHSVFVSDLIRRAFSDPVVALWALLHDAAEAYIADLPRPLKVADELTDYRAIEQNVQGAICVKFGLPLEMPEAVKRADNIALITEARDFMGDPEWAKDFASAAHIQPDEGQLVALAPRSALAQFQARLTELFWL